MEIRRVKSFANNFMKKKFNEGKTTKGERFKSYVKASLSIFLLT